MYIFIREDLSGPQRIVQASHAALEAGFRFNRPKTPTHVVLIGIKTQEELMRTSGYLQSLTIDHEMFHEPDYDTGFTAIATRPLYGDERLPMKKYKLLRD